MFSAGSNGFMSELDGWFDSAEVVADNVYFGESKKSREGASGGSYSNSSYSYNDGGYSAPPIETTFEVEDDGELPF